MFQTYSQAKLGDQLAGWRRAGKPAGRQPLQSYVDIGRQTEEQERGKQWPSHHRRLRVGNRETQQVRPWTCPDGGPFQEALRADIWAGSPLPCWPCEPGWHHHCPACAVPHGDEDSSISRFCKTWPDNLPEELGPGVGMLPPSPSPASLLPPVRVGSWSSLLTEPQETPEDLDFLMGLRNLPAVQRGGPGLPPLHPHPTSRGLPFQLQHLCIPGLPRCTSLGRLLPLLGAPKLLVKVRGGGQQLWDRLGSPRQAP